MTLPQTGAVRLITSSKALIVLSSNAFVFALVVLGRLPPPAFVDFAKWTIGLLIAGIAGEDASRAFASRPAATAPSATAYASTLAPPPPSSPPASLRDRATPAEGVPRPPRVPDVDWGG